MQWYFCLSWEATLVLSIWRVRVRKLYWQGATTVLPICACYLAHLSPDLCSKYGCTRITTVGQSPATMVQNGLQQSLCIAEKWSSEVVPVFPKRSRFELGKIRFFSLLIWHLAKRIFFQWDAGHHAVVLLLFLGATLVLSIWRVRVRKLYWQGATPVLPSCACYLAHLSPDLYSKHSCARMTTVGQPPANRV